MAKTYDKRQEWRQKAIQEIVESLTELGQEACRYAIQQREYNNRLYNLRDSIGSAVYVDGKIVPSSKRYAHSKSTRGPYKDKGWGGNGEYITGREALDRYWEENPTLAYSRNTVELVVIAATFYAGILESRGVQVISAAADYLEDEMDTYKGYSPKLRGYAGHIDVI